MRIIGGAFKGRTLTEFKGANVRPTSDNARESLFNILKNISGADFCDLFSGTGAVGIEALSRGANVAFNDVSRESVDLTRANLKKVGADTLSAQVYNFDAISFIKNSDKKFDVVFLDPPYKSPVSTETLNAVSTILKDDGIVVFENENVFVGTAKGLVLTDVRRYGRAILHFFAKKTENTAVFAGSFDPITVGHERIILDGAENFGKIYVVMGENSKKTPFFSEDERFSLLSAAFKGKNVELLRYSDFENQTRYSEFLSSVGAKYYVRGVRNERDFDYEKKAEKKNAELYPFIKTVYVFCEDEYKNVSSTKVKNLLKRGENALPLIPTSARETFENIIKDKAPK